MECEQDCAVAREQVGWTELAQELALALALALALVQEPVNFLQCGRHCLVRSLRR